MGEVRSRRTFNFKQWCEQHERTDWLKYWDYNVNSMNPEDCQTRAKAKCWFLTPDKQYDFQMVIDTITHNESKYFDVFNGSFLASLQQRFPDEWGSIWSKSNRLSPASIKKRTDNYKIKLICPEHGEYETTPKRAAMADFVCPKCAAIKRRVSNHNANRRRSAGLAEHIPNENLVVELPQVRDFWSDKNQYPPEDYSVNSSVFAFFKCDEGKHADYHRKICEAAMANFACPKCNRERTWSRLQRKVYAYISSKYDDIRNERECTFTAKNPLTGYPMPYDNEIVELGLIIEVQGMQHYRDYVRPNEMNAEGGNTRAFRDKEKREQAISHGYSYLEIPFYAEYKDQWKDMIDSAIDVISGGEQYF